VGGLFFDPCGAWASLLAFLSSCGSRFACQGSWIGFGPRDVRPRPFISASRGNRRIAEAAAIETGTDHRGGGGRLAAPQWLSRRSPASGHRLAASRCRASHRRAAAFPCRRIRAVPSPSASHRRRVVVVGSVSEGFGSRSVLAFCLPCLTSFPASWVTREYFPCLAAFCLVGLVVALSLRDRAPASPVEGSPNRNLACLRSVSRLPGFFGALLDRSRDLGHVIRAA
jgi:hypothetical protein